MARRGRLDVGRWQTHRERCAIGDPIPLCGGREAAPLSAVIRGVIESLPTGDMARMREIESEWVAWVGAEVARHARPGALKDGVLTVFVDNPVRTYELRSLPKALLTRIRERWGADALRRVVLNPDPDLAAGGGAGPGRGP